MTLPQVDSQLTQIARIPCSEALTKDPDLLGSEMLLLEDTQPIVETNVFNGRPEAAYWLGVVATPNMVESYTHNRLFTAARQLRYEVYSNKGYLGEESRDPDGGESDLDDPRSIHFIVLGSQQDDASKERVLGTARLIIKTDDSPLPVEKYFGVEAPERSVEASRFISQHEDSKTQHLIAMAEIKAMVDQALKLESPFVYAVVEKKLMQYFKIEGIPFETLPESNGGVILEKYGNTKNFAIRFKPEEVAQGVMARRRKNVSEFDAVRSMFALIVDTSSGLHTATGYYDEQFTRI